MQENTSVDYLTYCKDVLGIQSFLSLDSASETNEITNEMSNASGTNSRQLNVMFVVEPEDIQDQARELFDRMKSAMKLSKMSEQLLSDFVQDPFSDATVFIFFKEYHLLHWLREKFDMNLDSATRGELIQIAIGNDQTISVMWTYSPHQLVHSPADKRPVWEDMQKVMQLFSGKKP